ncbi:MAG TPA: TldD/PmbA family protein [Acidimicrobiaceae bacterium]|nr:TldD/PmbA family protein [Acidimicrobiaceae bacterium]
MVTVTAHSVAAGSGDTSRRRRKRRNRKDAVGTDTDTARGAATAALIETPVVERVLAAALAGGAEFAEVFAEDRRGTSASLDDGRIEELASGRDRGAGVRVVVGETTGYAHTADLSERGLLAAAEAAAAVARLGEGGTKVVALEPQVVPRHGTVEVLPEDVAKAKKIELLTRADESARSAGSAVSQVSANYADSRRRVLVANSDGVLVDDDQVRSRFFVTCVALGDTGMQTGFESQAFTVGFEMFDSVDVEEVATTAARRALTKLSARPAPSGELAVVLKAGSGGILFHEACGHGLEADHIVKDTSVYVGKVGTQVASPLVTLVDDGTVSREWGTFAIDDEGRPARRNVLIENGELTDYMWDFLRARKEGRVSSGNGRRQSYRHLPMVRMTNTFLLNGAEDPDEIVAQTPYGVYVAQLGGGQVNITTGDFVFGTSEAYLIEDGRITEPLRDANLIGNGPEILRRIDAVAGDFGMVPGTCGKDGQSVPVGCGQPTLRVSAITVGGTAGA